MYALRERRVHVTQEDFEMAVAKVNIMVDQWRGHIYFWYAIKLENCATNFCEESYTTGPVNHIILKCEIT